MTRSNSASHAAVTLRSRPGGVRRGTASSPPGFETVEHTGYGVFTPQHDVGNLRNLVILLGKQKHLIARPALHIGCFFITPTQLGKGCWIFWW